MPRQNPPSSLQAIITAVATKLLGATSRTASAISTEVLAELADFLDVDASFLRYNDHTIHATILVAEWPPRPDKPEPDPLHTIYFADADPIFAMSENAKEMLVLRPEPENADYQRNISEMVGISGISLAAVPLVSGNVTTGVFGLVKFGDRRWDEEEINALTVVATMFTQVQTRIGVEDRLNYQASHDDLTALPNRRTLLAHLEERLAAGQPGPVSVLFFNLDRLKAVNDFLGHEAGDAFIRDFAAGTLTAMQGRGMIARIGGAEFVVVPTNSMDLADATRLAESLSARLTDHVDVGGEVLNRTVSVGVATGTPGTESGLDLLRHADDALRSVKATGMDRIGVFSAEMRSQRRVRADVELHLAGAIETDALTVLYLPEIDMLTGKILAVEALVRWQHPTRGLLLPDLFIPVAESLNLAGELGKWVLNAACADLARWRSDGVGLDTMLRVNVSPAQLVAHDLVGIVKSTIDRFGLDGSGIGLEITESLLIRDLMSTRSTLRALTDIGIDIAIDDFGTGFSGMGLLRTLPVSTLKIDRGFVSDLETREDDLAIVRAVIGLAAAMGLNVVAEGVESAGAARILLREGCFRAQGYLFCRPITAAATHRLLAKGRISTNF